jgi:hypothetical protein
MDHFIRERTRQLLLEAEQQRLWEAARRIPKGTPDAARLFRPRVRVVGALRRFLQIAWAW